MGKFGDFVRARRAEMRLPLRVFCEKNGIDPSNWSKLERGLLKPPRGNTLRNVARALRLKQGSPQWYLLGDLAAAETGRIPAGLAGARRAAHLPVVFQAMRERSFPRELLVSGKSLQLPSGWGDDSLSAFIDQAQRNTQFVFERHREGYERLAAIDQTFEKLARSAPRGFSAFFLLKAHSAYRAAFRIGSSGQIPETYMVLRGALEWALYAAYLHENDERARRWLSRHDSAKTKTAVRNEFRVASLIGNLVSLDPTVGARLAELYDGTIDLGGHPNERALTSGIRPEKGATWQVDYFTTENSLSLQLALKTASRVGVCCLEVFELLFPERFRLLGVTDQLTQLRKGL